MKDPPELLKIMRDIENLNFYKYAAYRMALKMKIIQKAFKFNLMDLNGISTAFQTKSTQEHVFNAISMEHAEELLFNLFEVIKRQMGIVDDPLALAKLSLSFISKVFRDEEKVILYIYQMKMVLAMFCSATLRDKQKYIFNIFSDDGHIGGEHLHVLLKCFAKTAEVLGEKLSFGCQFLKISVKNCLKFSQTQEVSERTFLQWLDLEPQTLIFFSTFHRILVSERKEHRVKCNICRAFPVRGMRYKCLYCVSYSLCQECFLRGHSSRSHELKHPVQEFCYPASFWEEIKASLILVRNRLRFRNKWKENFLIFEEDTPASTSKPMVISEEAIEKDSIDDTKETRSISILEELFSVIEKLQEAYRIADREIRETENSFKVVGNCFIPYEAYKNWLVDTEDMLCSHTQIWNLKVMQLKEMMKHKQNSLPAESVRSEAQILSPQHQMSTFSEDAYLESTPLAVGSGNAVLKSPQNLSKFIKYRAKIDGLMNLSKTVYTNAQAKSLYSLADIELENLSSVNYSNEKMKEISETVVVGNIFKNKDHSSTKAVDCISAAGSSGISSNVSSVPHNTDILSERSSTFSSMEESERGALVTSPDSNIGSLSLSEFSRNSVHISNCEEKSSVSNVEAELQQLLEQLESLYPKVTDIQKSIPEQKDKFLNALSDMEEALKRLSTTITDDDFSVCRL